MPDPREIPTGRAFALGPVGPFGLDGLAEQLHWATLGNDNLSQKVAHT